MPTRVAGILKLEANLVGVFRMSKDVCSQAKPMDAEDTEGTEQTAEDEAMVHVAQISVKNPQNLPLLVDRISYTVNNNDEMTAAGSTHKEVKANGAVTLELPLPASVRPATGFGGNFRAADLQIGIAMFVRLPESEEVCKIDLVI